jgi:WhiB family transcriptional regulator, redox-sensing transcriptional regulator
MSSDSAIIVSPTGNHPTQWTESIIEPEPWTQDALCAQTDPEAFFPEKGGSTKDAKRICNGKDDEPGCEVREQCLAYALANDERFGIWGGYSERERRRLRRGLPAKAARRSS